MCVLAKSGWWIDEGGGLETCLRQATPQDSQSSADRCGFTRPALSTVLQSRQQGKRKGSLYTRQERSRIVYSRKEERIATKRWGKTTVELLVCRRQKSRKKGRGRDVILFFGDKNVYTTLARIMAVWEGV